jgi:hypothetical protein
MRRCERAQARIITHVFHRYGRPIKSPRRVWKTGCREAGRPGLLLHDPRRSAVQNLERAGISRSVATKLTGHQTEAVYRRYVIAAEGISATRARSSPPCSERRRNRLGSVTIPETTRRQRR